MSDRRTERFEGREVDELLASLMDSEPGSIAHEQVKTAIAVRIAEMQRETSENSLAWGRVSAVSTLVATVIALVALLVALL